MNGAGQTARRPYRMDKRAVAAQQTGQRIIQATTDLYMERWLEDLTLDEVAARAGVTVQTVYRWQNGTRRMSPEHARLLGEWLGLNPMDLLLGERSA